MNTILKAIDALRRIMGGRTIHPAKMTAVRNILGWFEILTDLQEPIPIYNPFLLREALEKVKGAELNEYELEVIYQLLMALEEKPSLQ